MRQKPISSCYNCHVPGIGCPGNTDGWTLLKPERTQNPERAQNVLQLRSGFSTERTFFILPSKKVRSGFSPERDFQIFRFSTMFWF